MYFLMIQRNKTVLTLLFTCCLGFIFCQFNSFKYRAKLSQPSSTWHKVKLTPSVFDAVKTDFSDIRIFNIKKQDTIELPYILKTNYKKYKKQLNHFNIINQSQKTGVYYYTFTRLDELEINEINLTFNAKNFDFKITLQGSDDGKDWFDICTNYRLLSISNEQTNFEFTKLVFSAVSYRYFRLVIPNKEDPSLVDATYSKSNVMEKSLEKNSHFTQKIIHDKSNKQTIIDITFEKKSLFSKLHIPVQNKFDFYRHISIYSTTQLTNCENIYDCDYIYNGTLNSLDGQEIEIGQNFVKNMRIIIDNKDNQTLTIGAIESFFDPIYLFGRFELEGDFYLCFGKAQANLPEYDLTYFEDRIPDDVKELTYDTKIQKEPKQENQKHSSNAMQKWLWIIILLIVLVLSVFTLKMMKTKS